jgi:hypothetical protein
VLCVFSHGCTVARSGRSMRVPGHAVLRRTAAAWLSWLSASTTDAGAGQHGQDERAAVTSVIRTYAAADRAAAERSFEREREQAAGRGWEPKSQRWRTEGREQVLTVVYESRDARAAVAWTPGSPAGDTQAIDIRSGDARSAVADPPRRPWDELRAGGGRPLTGRGDPDRTAPASRCADPAASRPCRNCHRRAPCLGRDMPTTCASCSCTSLVATATCTAPAPSP